MATHAPASASASCPAYTAASRPRTGQRPATTATSIAGVERQRIICAVSESRGISPTVGLAIVNLDTVQAVLCQICDSQTYVRTIHKLQVYAPNEILIVSTAANPKSKLFSIIEENLEDIDSRVTLVDRRYWAETAGAEYIQQLAFTEDVEAIKLSLEGNYFCATKYIEVRHGQTFLFHSLSIKYEPCEGSMMIDVSTIRALELIQNLENPKSRNCLFGLLNETHTPMGARLLRSNILQPVTDEHKLTIRYDALEEISSKEDMFFASGVNGLLDVARQAYREATEDAYQLVAELGEEHGIHLAMKFDTARQFYIQINAADLEDRLLPPVFTNVYKKKSMIECQTLDLMKRNQKIVDAHNEVVCLSTNAVQDLIVEIRGSVPVLFKVCESIAMLDMVSSFAHIVTSQDYTRPSLTDTLAIKAGRHPIREKIQSARFVPNDFYATQQKRFQVITGCNMSGKSTYIRSVALMSVMTQIGMFVPAQYASMPIRRQLFARVALDDRIEANVSSFAAEMRETAFILRNISKDSIAIIDELGRGTSTRDGLAIALAIAEALVDSRALIWFATHFRELANIMTERNGIVNLHLAVDMRDNGNIMNMLYRIAEGPVKEQHYGLALARVVSLPLEVLEKADEVSTRLQQRIQRRKKASATVVRERRRKLILNLREHLLQAQSGAMHGEVLADWLKGLQREFVIRMAAVDADASGTEDVHDLQTNDGNATVVD
ncbi:MutS protein msh4 [Neofusicoccum ribis]|uniref:MutS protein msh4 n=1 Tax=Neofusicoccum ribis TaxID=45134 RepID=A0ABR3SM63_9PEZI